MNQRHSVQAIAFYLPQFHRIPENDEWWGEGFTEWTNVRKAQPLFAGHQQPIVPGELGYYDLVEQSEIRQKQANLAREYGITGFCYWHYWFGGGKTLLQKPFQEVLSSRKPDFPFCLGWANESWTGVWHGAEHRVLQQQQYRGIEDERAHFYYVLPALQDDRYITVDGKPIFIVYKPSSIPDVRGWIARWTLWATQNGFPGIYFIGIVQREHDVDLERLGFDAVVYSNQTRIHELCMKNPLLRLRYQRRTEPYVYTYADAARYFIEEKSPYHTVFPCVVPNWDHTPRSGKRGIVLSGSTPELFGKHVSEALRFLEKRSHPSLLFIKSWNEWAEGNYLEPDARWNSKYLEEFARNVQ